MMGVMAASGFSHRLPWCGKKNKKQQQKNKEMSSALDAFPIKSPTK